MSEKEKNLVAELSNKLEIDLPEKRSIEELKQLLRDNQIVQSMHVTAIFYALIKLGELQF